MTMLWVLFPRQDIFQSNKSGNISNKNINEMYPFLLTKLIFKFIWWQSRFITVFWKNLRYYKLIFLYGLDMHRPCKICTRYIEVRHTWNMYCVNEKKIFCLYRKKRYCITRKTLRSIHCGIGISAKTLHIPQCNRLSCYSLSQVGYLLSQSWCFVAILFICFFYGIQINLRVNRKSLYLKRQVMGNSNKLGHGMS